MAESYPCPRCGNEVPIHLVFGGQTSCNPAGLEPSQFQHQKCSRCGAKLQRATNIPD